MNKRTIISLFCLFSLTLLSAMPRLTVVVVVDGLSSESLHLLRPYWQQGGLRTLSEEAYQTHLFFPHPVYGGNETTATLMTGLLPREHGYAMDRCFRRIDRRVCQLLSDEHYHGIGSDQALSPRAILSPTLSDKVRLREGRDAKIYSIGIEAPTAIVMAGHSANACCWLEPDTPHWAASSFYSEGLPSAADQMNISGRVTELAARTWTPRLDMLTYNRPTDRERKHGFSYISASVLHRSPAANELVVELALNLQKSQQLGVDMVPDLLLLQMTALSPAASSDRIATAEQEDQYLWLNQHLGYLMEQLTKRLGKENYQILVVGRPVLGHSAEQLAEAGLTTQRFNVDQAAALASTYLMAIYGHERWIDGAYGQSIYLNRTLIERKKMSLTEIQNHLAHFLMDFEGVQLAFPALEATHQPALLPSYTKRCFGDILFTLEPGWQLMANDHDVTDHVLDAMPAAPLLWWTGSVRAFPEQPVTALDLDKLLIY